MALKWLQRMIERAVERSDERDRQDREKYNLSFRNGGRVATTVDKILRSPKVQEQVREIRRLQDSGVIKQG